MQKKSKYFVLISFLICGQCLLGQIMAYQDIFKGGVTGDAFNPWFNNQGGNFEVYIEPGSTIRQAYLFLTVYNNPDDKTLLFNGYPISLNASNTFNNEYVLIDNSDIRRMKTLMIDVTAYIQPSQSIYSVSALIQPSDLIPGIYCEYYLYVAYENSSMQEICANIVVNNIQPNAQMNYTFGDLNSINLQENVGLAINASNMCDTLSDGSFVNINGTNMGLVGGQDENGLVSCAGVMGTFYYQNATLYGLGNDTPNSIMLGLDGIANIETYINNPNSFDLEFDYQSNLAPQTNSINQFYLTYISACSAFSFSSPNDTTLCRGSTLQLNATGGSPTSNSATGYEWSPAIGLSCTDCPNPVFTADSSMFYTVRIWNTDSCSVVRPLKINVRPAPLWDSLAIMPSVCGSSTGSVTVFALPNNSMAQSWSEVGGSPQSSNVFQNLSGGNHTFYFIDSNSCQSSDTTVFIPSINPTIAQFTANPLSGVAPLEVNFTNTSTNATNYLWYVNGDNQGNALSSLIFDPAGIYNISLVAWQNDILCADTFSLQIIAFDSLVVQIPNVFSPNGDGVNESFTITANQDVAYNFTIVNRWGNPMKNGTGNFLGGVSHPIWNGIDAVDGVYFLKIEFTQLDGKKLDYQGFLQLVR